MSGVYYGSKIRPAILAASKRRVDFVGLGDSNQLLGGHGWDHGFHYALSNAFGLYATQLLTQSENQNSGNGSGRNYSIFPHTGFAYTGAPSELAAYMDKGAGGMHPHYYSYVASGSSIAAGVNTGITALQNTVLDNTAPLIFSVNYGTFPSGTGSFRSGIRIDASPFTMLTQSATTSTNTGAYGMSRLDVQLSADAARTQNLAGRLTPIQITGPWFMTFQRLHNPSRTAGVSYHTLDFRGGQSARTLAVDVQQASDTYLTHYFGEIRRLQSEPRSVVVVINSGLNDRNETLASVGTEAVADGDSAEAFADNLQAIIDRLTALWSTNGWSASELYFLLVPSHAVSNPDDTELAAYRTAAVGVAVANDRTSAVNLAELADSDTMLANGWYASGGADTAHLTQTGYEQMATLVVDALETAAALPRKLIVLDTGTGVILLEKHA